MNTPLRWNDKGLGHSVRYAQNVAKDIRTVSNRSTLALSDGPTVSANYSPYVSCSQFETTITPKLPRRFPKEPSSGGCNVGLLPSARWLFTQS